MLETQLLLDITRLFIGIIILSYASYTDIKTRMANNILWIIMGGIGVILIIIQFFTVGFSNIIYLGFIPIMIGFTFFVYYLSLLKGGADLKAFWGLTFLAPIEPIINNFPLWKSFMPFPWVIFSNSVILVIFITLGVFIWNVLKHNIEFPYCFFGYKMKIEVAKNKFVWPLEKIVNGKRKIVVRPTNFDITDDLIKFEKLGMKEIWVQPKLPFMTQILAGFLISFILGDLVSKFIQLFL